MLQSTRRPSRKLNLYILVFVLYISISQRLIHNDKEVRQTTQIMIVVANDAGKIDSMLLNDEATKKCVELMCHEKHENQNLSQVVCDMIDDVVDVWIEKMEE